MPYCFMWKSEWSERQAGMMIKFALHNCANATNNNHNYNHKHNKRNSYNRRRHHHNNKKSYVLMFFFYRASSYRIISSALNRRTVQPFTESDDNRCCENIICPAEDGHANARNMSRIVM
jgi:ABC-type Zn2+ transport system substrate-binding protein/surface adhesin